jgi:hypothetical protein
MYSRIFTSIMLRLMITLWYLIGAEFGFRFVEPDGRRVLDDPAANYERPGWRSLGSRLTLRLLF